VDLKKQRNKTNEKNLKISSKYALFDIAQNQQHKYSIKTVKKPVSHQQKTINHG